MLSTLGLSQLDSKRYICSLLMRLFIDLILLIVSPLTLTKIKQLQNLEVIPRPFKQCFDLILKFELKKEKIFPPDCYLDWIVQIQDFQSVVFYSGRLLHQPSPILVDEHAGVVWFSRNHRNNITFFLSCDSKEITW